MEKSMIQSWRSKFLRNGNFDSLKKIRNKLCLFTSQAAEHFILQIVRQTSKIKTLNERNKEKPKTFDFIPFPSL